MSSAVKPLFKAPLTCSLISSGRFQRCQHRKIEHAPRFLIQTRARPRISPTPFSCDALESHHEIVSLGDTAVHVIRAQNLPPESQTFFEHLAFVCHFTAPNVMPKCSQILSPNLKSAYVSNAH